jgi:hypothetical protein
VYYIEEPKTERGGEFERELLKYYLIENNE